MPRKRMAQNKAGYAAILWTYEDRRSKMVRGNRESEKKFSIRRKKIGVRIRTIRRSIKILEGKRHDVNQINHLMISFSGLSMWKIGGRIGNHDKNRDLCKKCFYKYCIDNGVKGSFVADYCGLIKKDAPADSRRLFTRSFKANNDNRLFYHRFLDYIKQSKCQ